MAHESDLEAEEALTKDEIEGDAPPTKNAFAELMAPKPKAQPKPSPSRASKGFSFGGRMGLGEYLDDPQTFPSSIVLYHTEDFVAIRDKFPKATIHTLLLPRSPAVSLRHPFDALEDAAFLAKVQAETRKLRALVAGELRRTLGQHSAADRPYQDVLSGRAEPTGPDGELPAGRDWEAEVISGVHAVPSMSHVHVHVLSRDMHSPAMRHAKHYNSFTTPFLVDVGEFPLAPDDPRRDTKRHPYLKSDLTCWRCGANFGNQFKKLKEHLEVEFKAWKKE
ncbi:HIT-like domain-containing protein [Stachybotrys elegans]|uniref:Aprataxin-like protein n=1 Tax=Stachybotrys elegans TaxID=80388 RepID=A0A8K0SVN9_9HYPO|nr:HIT-like domain-containing protein [Stachybotrys elegans]